MSKLSKKELAEKAKEVFDSNPELKKGHQTTDGQVFESENNAVQHQLLLTKRAEDVEEVYPAESKSKKDSGDDAGSLEGLKLAELQALCVERGYPNEEWKSFTAKKEVIEYINSKAPQE